MSLALAPTGEAAPSPWAASDLAGPLYVQQDLTEFSASDLEHLAQSLIEADVAVQFRLADVFVEVMRRAGDRPSDRGRALDELCRSLNINAGKARRYVRVARAFPPEKREQYPQFFWGHYEVLTDRTHRDGDTPDERQERIEALAAEAADRELGVNGTRRLVEETLRPDSLPPVEEFLLALQDGAAPEAQRRWPSVPLEIHGQLCEFYRQRAERALRSAFRLVRD